MSANTGTRIKRHESKRLGGRRLYNFPHIDAANSVTELGQLIYQSNVDASENILKQLDHLRCLWGGHGDDLRNDLLTGQACQSRASFGYAAYHHRRVGGGKILPTGIDTFRRKRQIEILSHLEPRRFQSGQDNLFGGFGKRCALQNDQLSLAQMCCKTVGRFFNK